MLGNRVVLLIRRTLLPLFVVAVLTTITFAQTAPSTVTFRTQTFNNSRSATAIVSGDFNGDGRPDLAICDEEFQLVQVFLGDGTGHFTLRHQHQAVGTSSPNLLIAGYFNNDTHLDLLVAGTGGGTTVLLGNGDGTFTDSVGFFPPFAGHADSMIGANLLNDGLTQVALTRCVLTPHLACFLEAYQPDNRGIFSLAQSISVPTGGALHSLATDDFNLDNKPDIALGSGDEMKIFKNASAFNGGGSAHLTLLTSFRLLTAGIDAIVSGHFNAGAGPDLALVSDKLYIYLNTGSGTFFLKQAIPFNTDFIHFQFVAADVNGDGIQDLVSLALFENRGLEYRLGRGDGTFGPAHAIPGSADGANEWVITRDVNRDSRQDVVVVRGVDASGAAATHVLVNQNALTNCPSPGSDTVRVKFCSATPHTDSLTVRGSGNSPAGVKRVELWIDGKKRAQTFSDQLHATVAVSAGKHRVTLVGVDLYDKLAKQPIFVTIP